jgi:CubicO group peptidase (beta-lactamase class C family)
MKKLIIFFCLFPYLIHAQHQTTDSLDAFIAKQVIDYKIPGLAIGIIKDNQIIFKKGYGVNSTVDSLPVTTQTIFPILSCTKAFTAAAMGILVDRGKMNWNDKVIKYLPNFKLSDPWITKELTIADILSHRSGLESFEGDLLWYGTTYTRQEIVRRIQYSPVRNNFRADYGYQNIMYLVAGLIIEKITGQTWDNFINDSLFIPLSMTSSSTSILKMLKNENYAHPHLRNKPIPLMNMDNIGPAGSINSTIDDMLLWMKLWINEGSYNGKKILSHDALQTITTPKVMLSGKSTESYGFGWNIGVENGKKVIAHGGGMPGFKSTVSISPDNRTGIVILSNKISYFNDELMGIIMEYLESKQINWKQADKDLYFKNFNFDWDQEPDISSQLNSYIPDLSLYEGQYEDKGYGKAVIRLESEKAILELLPTKKLFSGRLYYVSTDTLKIIFKDAFIPAGEVVFKRGRDKKVISFKLNISSSDFHFKYLNFKKN